MTYSGHKIAWMSKKEGEVAMLTVGTEYRCMADMMQRAAYPQTLAHSFETQRARLVLNNYNMPAITIINALGATKRSKFINRRHQYLKQQISNNYIYIKHVPSRILPADMFTKTLDLQRLQMLRQLISVAEIPNLEEPILPSR